MRRCRKSWLLLVACLIGAPALAVALVLPPVIYHRGGAGIGPENTLAAIERGLEDGADGFELDLRVTSDGHTVLMHDDTVDRTTDGTGRVVDLSLAEIKALDAGSWFGPAFAGEQVPTLVEALTAINAGSGLVLLDRPPGDVAEDIAAAGFPGDRIFVWHIDLNQPPGWTASVPGVRLIYNFPRQREEFDQELLDDLVAGGFWGVQLIFESTLTQEFVDTLHANGLAAFRFQSAQPNAVEKLIQVLPLGIDLLNVWRPSDYRTALQSLPAPVPLGRFAAILLTLALGLVLAIRLGRVSRAH